MTELEKRRENSLECLPSKETFLQEMDAFLQENAARKWCVAAVDVEKFKLYNEWYGIARGDQLLEALAGVLVALQQEKGWPVGYFGNDDFFLCLPDDDAEVEAVYQRLQTCVQESGENVTFFVSLGLCPAQEGTDGHTLCSYAQMAATAHAENGRSWNRFCPDMVEKLKRRQQLLTELERALQHEEFCFYLQPKCNSMTHAIVGMEALVRWNHPTRGLIAPGEFVPLMEETGLITRLDLYLWEAVCKKLHAWKTRKENMVPISVNVSIADISSMDVAQVLWEMVQKYQLEPRLLLVEITESMLAQNMKMVEDAITALHRKGFSVLMDDFGSGYSSLNMLRNTSVDGIKLDMKFIVKDGESSKGRQIVESVIEMARRLNLPIIAEGVETQEQVYMLQSMDCLYTQGYYFYKPMSVEKAEQLLAQPTMEHYWDLRRDLTCRNYRAFTGGTVSEKSAVALQAFQIFADNALEIARLDLSTGEYWVVKRDARLGSSEPEAPLNCEEYWGQLVAQQAICPEDAGAFWKHNSLETLRSALFREHRPYGCRFRQKLDGGYRWVRMQVLPGKDCSAESPWAVVVLQEELQK